MIFFNKYKKIRNKLIFCINPGRSGSEYLSFLLGTGDNVLSFHEPEPKMNGEYVAMVNQYSLLKSYNKRRIKSKAIYDLLKYYNNSTKYIETNHMFIKTFYDVIINDFDNVEVILLRRKLPELVRSFAELNYFTSENSAWQRWMTSPLAKTRAINCVEPYDDLDHFDKTIAYLIDIESRAYRFQKEFPHIKVHQLYLDRFNEFNYVEQLFENLKIGITERTKIIFEKKINTRKDKKLKFNHSVDITYCSNRINEYIKKAEFQNISLPDTLYI